MATTAQMRLKVSLPRRMLIDEDVVKVTAEAPGGSFCLLPRHVDFVTSLTAGLLTYEERDGSTTYVGVDEGVLVKCGQDVHVATRRGVVDRDLEQIDTALGREIRRLDDRERRTRTELARLEVSLLRRFLEAQHDAGR